jgi:hypothetical protein
MSKLQLLLGKHQDTAEGKVSPAGKMGRGTGHRGRCRDKSVELQPFLNETTRMGVMVNAFLRTCIISSFHSYRL